LGLSALIQHHSAFKRIAVVSDQDWIAHALHAFAWMIPGDLGLFGLDELERVPRNGPPADCLALPTAAPGRPSEPHVEPVRQLRAVFGGRQ
jgi:hypothetical protein